MPPVPTPGDCFIQNALGFGKRAVARVGLGVAFKEMRDNLLDKIAVGWRARRLGGLLLGRRKATARNGDKCSAGELARVLEINGRKGAEC